jgi:hypothetical protein
VANGVERQFEKYMPHFGPFLVLGLQNHEQHQVILATAALRRAALTALRLPRSPLRGLPPPLATRSPGWPLAHRLAHPRRPLPAPYPPSRSPRSRPPHRLTRPRPAHPTACLPRAMRARAVAPRCAPWRWG